MAYERRLLLLRASQSNMNLKFIYAQHKEGGCGGVPHVYQAHPEMFRDVVERLTLRLQKKDTWYRDSQEVDLKVAITLMHLGTGDCYKSMVYLCYVPHNTTSLIVRDACQAIWDEFGDEVVTNPTTAEGWKEDAAASGTYTMC